MILCRRASGEFQRNPVLSRETLYLQIGNLLGGDRAFAILDETGGDFTLLDKNILFPNIDDEERLWKQSPNYDGHNAQDDYCAKQ